jgi:hypothetical protein
MMRWTEMMGEEVQKDQRSDGVSEGFDGMMDG